MADLVNRRDAWRMVERKKFQPWNHLARCARCVPTTFAIFALLAVIFSSAPFAANVRAQAEACAQEDSSAPAPLSKTSKLMRKNLKDFGEVTPTLYRGAQPTKKGFRMLARMGINIVIDLRGNRKSERKFVESLGMQYVPIGWECSFPRDKTFARFLMLLQQNPDKKVFVHCRVGDDRTSMMIASYRIAEQGWSAERAKLEMEDFGFSFVHRHLICPRLASYEMKFPRRFSTSPAFRDLRHRNENP